MLDLCWVNFRIVVNNVKPLIKEDNYHPALLISTDLGTIKEEMKSYYCSKKGDFSAFNNYFLSINWVQ